MSLFYSAFGFNDHGYISFSAPDDAESAALGKLKQEAFYRRYNGIDDEYWSAEKAWFLLKNCAMVWPASGEKEYSEKCQITILVSEKRCCSNRLSGSVSNNYPGYMWGASWL